MTGFNREMLGKWAHDPEYERAYLLWVAYYWQTEDHDRFVCGGIMDPNTGVALSAWGPERDACNRNARHMTEWVLRGAQAMRIPKDKLRMARREASTNDHARNEEILLRHGKDPWHESSQHIRLAVIP